MSVRDDLPIALSPWLTPDLQAYLEAVGSLFEQIELYADDTDDAEGWTILLDVDRCPVEALPYLAQYVGERLPVGLSEAASREWIKDAPNMARGTNYAMFRAAQRKLTGTRLVALRERDGVGSTVDLDRISVRTLTAETPDPVGTYNDIRSVTAEDLILDYETVDGASWQDTLDENPTWADVMSGYASWYEVLHALPQASTFTRPSP